jgi:hypothetical protein
MICMMEDQSPVWMRHCSTGGVDCEKQSAIDRGVVSGDVVFCPPLPSARSVYLCYDFEPVICCPTLGRRLLLP